MMECDFHGWATKANLKCSDGRTIMKDAFKHNDGQTVPLVWNHKHDSPDDVLGHAILENRDEGVYTYCCFNNTTNGQLAKVLVQHGDITSLSIYANRLKQQGGNVLHGEIREVSLVHAGANPGAVITSVIAHSDDGEPIMESDGCIVHTGEEFSLYHAEDSKCGTGDNTDKKDNADEPKENETVGDVFDTFTEKQKNVVYALIAQLIKEEGDSNDDNDSEGGNDNMKHNVFDQEEIKEGGVLSHADQENIISLAKTNGVGSLQTAIDIYAENNDALSHGIDEIETLFPDYKDVNPGAPELITRDLGWVGAVLQKTHKSPISRIRTRQADARITDLRGLGYKKGNKKNVTANIKLLKRTTDPQTVFVKDALHRDDIIDITDFDVVQYQYGIMQQVLKEELAIAAMIGDGREEGDENKISEEHIRPIWKDDELYTIHADVDIAAAKAELQGTNTSANFGDNYVYAEAIISASLYARETYKGSGTPDFYCTPHLLNVMLLARDLNGRRIYESKTDLAAALNVKDIYTVEQFEGKIRTTTEGAKKKLLGIFVNMADYQFGATKGGEITKFEQFDIDFNQQKVLIETRTSGALTRVFSAIALEEPVTEAAG